MKPNKAITDTLTVSASTNANKHEKSPQIGLNEAGERDNPFITTLEVQTFNKVMGLKKQMSAAFNIHFAGFEVLMKITDHWLSGRGGITLHGIVEGNVNIKVKTCYKVTRLLGYGLIEVVGQGFAGSRQYAPSARFLRMLNEGKVAA